MARFNEQLADLLWESCVIGVALVKLTGHVERANPAFCNLVEFTEAELQGRHFKEFTHPEDIDADVEMARRLVAGEISFYVMRKRHLTKTGRTVWIKLRVDAYRDEDGELHILLAQVSPIEQDGPPRFPGDLELSRAAKSRELHKLIKWAVTGLIGLGLVITGAIIDNSTLLTLGSTILVGSGIAASAERRDGAAAASEKR